MAELPALNEDWQSQMTRGNSFWHMCENQLGCNIVFHVGHNAEIVGAHSFVLMSRSSVFFNDFIKESPQCEIVLRDVEPRDFRLFLKFLYTGQTDINNETEEGIGMLAKKYNVQHLEMKLLTSRLTHMNGQEFCKFVKQNERQIRNDYFKFACLKYVIDHTDQVFTSTTFSVIPRQFLKDIITHEYIVLQEELIYKGVLCWATSACENVELEPNGENQRKVLGRILYDVRFPLLSHKFFDDYVCETGLLSSAEEVTVLKYFLHGEQAVGASFKFKFQPRIGPVAPIFHYEGNELSPNRVNERAERDMPRRGGASGNLEENTLSNEYAATTYTKCFEPIVPCGPPSPEGILLLVEPSQPAPILSMDSGESRDSITLSKQPTLLSLFRSGDASQSKTSTPDVYIKPSAATSTSLFKNIKAGGDSNPSSSAATGRSLSKSDDNLNSTLTTDGTPSSSSLNHPDGTLQLNIEKQENLACKISPTITDDQTVSMVTRFTESGYGWGYCRNKKDAVCFISSKNIHLESVMLYGSRDASWPISLKFEFLKDDSQCIYQFNKSINVQPSEDMYNVSLGDDGCNDGYSLVLMANKEYHILVTVSGVTKGYFGKNGQVNVTSGGVDFQFKKSKYSMNNTNELQGQIPGFKFMVKEN